MKKKTGRAIGDVYRAEYIRAWKVKIGVGHYQYFWDASYKSKVKAGKAARKFARGIK